MTTTARTIDTPDGPFTLVVDGDGAVLASGWSADVDAVVARIHPSLRPLDVTVATGGTTVAADAVRAYYAGDPTAIDDVAVRHHGTALQLAGWAALRRIGPGEPLSYTAFADVVGSPAAVRAAAGICARNAPALFVPCHRVLRSDGSLGGFAWGEEVKRSLLDREAHWLAGSRPAVVG
ncbi:methylated-DNA--[protein]-cysteine S-methyltransferase [Tessaracoccus terricola]